MSLTRMKAIGEQTLVRCQGCSLEKKTKKPSAIAREHVVATGHVVDIVRTRVTSHQLRHPQQIGADA